MLHEPGVGYAPFSWNIGCREILSRVKWWPPRMRRTVTGWVVVILRRQSMMPDLRAIRRAGGWPGACGSAISGVPFSALGGMVLVTTDAAVTVCVIVWRGVIIPVLRNDPLWLCERGNCAVATVFNCPLNTVGTNPLEACGSDTVAVGGCGVLFHVDGWGMWVGVL